MGAIPVLLPFSVNTPRKLLSPVDIDVHLNNRVSTETIACPVVSNSMCFVQGV